MIKQTGSWWSTKTFPKEPVVTLDGVIISDLSVQNLIAAP